MRGKTGFDTEKINTRAKHPVHKLKNLPTQLNQHPKGCRRSPEGDRKALWNYANDQFDRKINSGYSKKLTFFILAGDFASVLAPDTPSQCTSMLPDFFRAGPARIPKERRSQLLCWKRRFCLLSLLLMLDRRADKIAEQRMRTVRSGL